MTKHPLILCLLIGFVFATSAWGGTVYRWVDENGNVQFSENPPSDRQSEQTGYRTGRSSSSGDSGPSMSSPQRSDRSTSVAEPAEEAAETPAELTQEQIDDLAGQHQANCETARAGLETIANNPRIRVEEDGEMRFLSPDEIEERREQMESVQAESCNWSPPVSGS